MNRITQHSKDVLKLDTVVIRFYQKAMHSKLTQGNSFNQKSQKYIPAAAFCGASSRHSFTDKMKISKTKVVSVHKEYTRICLQHRL
jgi:hypothetical protein